jgi:hypothetical protein
MRKPSGILISCICLVLVIGDTEKKSSSIKPMFISIIFRDTFGSCQTKIVAIKYA